MRDLKTLMAGAVAVFALAGTASAAESWRQVAYTCDSGPDLTVAFKDTGKAARVTVADRAPVRLVARPAREGERFADSRHELRVNGNSATWQVGDRSPVECRAVEDTKLAAQ